LVQRAAEHRDEAPEEAEDQVARLVEDEVHTVEERAGPARGERQALAENSECDPEEEQEADGAAGDRGHQSASVATTGAWSEGFAEASRKARKRRYQSSLYAYLSEPTSWPFGP